MTDATRTTIDPAEVERFSRIAAEWWNPQGKFRPLHKFNPTRLAYIKEQICKYFNRDPLAAKPLEGLRLLDIGCGGGLLCEPMARLGAIVVGADASETNIEVAKIHAAEMGLDIDYRATTAEALADAGEQFDIVLNMEVVEHVSDIDLFMTACATMVKPDGLMFVATINRTLKALGLAIIGAEYILRWLPRGTHQYEKLVRPQQIETPLIASGLQIKDRIGVSYNPLTDSWSRSRDLDVNYMLLAQKHS